MSLTQAEKQARYREGQKLKLAALVEGNVTNIDLTIQAASVDWLETTRLRIDAELEHRAKAAKAKERGKTDPSGWGRF